jgi:antirestriction protein ArdC
MSTSDSKASWAELLQKAVTEPGIISEAFRTFHNYSLGNQMLAMLQCGARGIQPGPIGTFMHWKELGRHVKKGERAIMLCMPISAKRKEAVTDEAGNESERESVAQFFVYKNNWFVLSQTEGAEYEAEPIPGWDETKALAALDIHRVEFGLMNGNVQGYAKGREVAINPVAEQAECTLFHEVGHIVLGHTAEGTINSDAAERTPRDIRELEAECVALLCCESLGLPGAEVSRGYIQGWYKGNTVPEKSAQRIFHAADQILKAGTEVRL